MGCKILQKDSSVFVTVYDIEKPNGEPINDTPTGEFEIRELNTETVLGGPWPLNMVPGVDDAMDGSGFVAGLVHKTKYDLYAVVYVDGKVWSETCEFRAMKSGGCC